MHHAFIDFNYYHGSISLNEMHFKKIILLLILEGLSCIKINSLKIKKRVVNLHSSKSTAAKTSTPRKTTKEIHGQRSGRGSVDDITAEAHNTALALNRNRPIFELRNHTQINHPAPRHQPEQDISICTSGLCEYRRVGAYMDQILIL